MDNGVFIGLTEEKLKRIMELPYILLAQQISEEKNIDITVTAVVTKNAS